MGGSVCNQVVMKMFVPFLVLFSYVLHVEATPKGRVARALPPEYRYANFDGWEACVMQQPPKPGQTIEEYCLPTSRLDGCPSSVWGQLKDEYDPNNDIEFVGAPPGAPPIAGGPAPVGVGAPAYLDVPGFELCLGEHASSDSDHTEWCRPANKPEYCSQKAWDDLKTKFDGDCPVKVDPSEIPGYDLCILETKIEIMPHCLPFTYKPRYCSENSWKEI